jgi:hypothetical protein
MNKQIGQYSLEEVLDAYVAATIEPSREILAKWVKRFPQYADELAEFTLAWIQTDQFPENGDARVNSNTRIQIGVDIARRVYDRRSIEENTQFIPLHLPLASLFQAGNMAGFSPDQLKDTLNLSMAILRKIENRFFIIETLPANLIQNIAQTLHRNTQEILTYLNQEPMIPSALRLKSHQAPKISRKENFFDALREDDSLTQVQLTYWLSFEKDK